MLQQETLFPDDETATGSHSLSIKQWPLVDRSLIMSLKRKQKLERGDDLILANQLLSLCHSQGILLGSLPITGDYLASRFRDPKFIQGKRLYWTIAFTRTMNTQWIRLNVNDQYSGFKHLQRAYEKHFPQDLESGCHTVSPSLMQQVTLRPQVIRELHKLATQNELTHGIRSKIKEASWLYDTVYSIFVTQYTPLVWKAINAAKIDANSVNDYLSVGLEGIVSALNSFDPTKGYAFATHARFWIKKAVLSHLDWNAKYSAYEGVSLDDSQQNEYIDTQQTDHCDIKSYEELINGIFSHSSPLTVREKNVIESRFIQERSLKDTSELLAVHIETVRLATNSALAKIRQLPELDQEKFK